MMEYDVLVTIRGKVRLKIAPAHDGYLVETSETMIDEAHSVIAPKGGGDGVQLTATEALLRHAVEDIQQEAARRSMMDVNKLPVASA